MDQTHRRAAGIRYPRCQRGAGLGRRLLVGEIRRQRFDPGHGAVPARDVDNGVAVLNKLLRCCCANTGACTGQYRDRVHEDSRGLSEGDRLLQAQLRVTDSLHASLGWPCARTCRKWAHHTP